MERREDKRRRILKRGSIQFWGSAIDCSVRNINGEGALLEVESPLGVPRAFTLVVPADALKRDCRVVWIREKRLGVEFRTSPAERRRPRCGG